MVADDIPLRVCIYDGDTLSRSAKTPASAPGS
jgi:hypothetical protein